MFFSLICRARRKCSTLGNLEGFNFSNSFSTRGSNFVNLGYIDCYQIARRNSRSSKFRLGNFDFELNRSEPLGRWCKFQVFETMVANSFVVAASLNERNNI